MSTTPLFLFGATGRMGSEVRKLLAVPEEANRFVLAGCVGSGSPPGNCPPGCRWTEASAFGPGDLEALPADAVVLDVSLAATGGAHTPEDVLKLLLAGADCVMLASSLLTKGPAHIGALVRGVQDWMVEREYSSVTQMKGSLSQQSCPDPDAFERANYMRALQSYTSDFV